jgi:hypothetical protein
MLSYSDKSQVMSILFAPYKVTGGFTCTYKNVPIALYEKYKEFIDFTAFRGMFRGKRAFKTIMTRSGHVYKQYDAFTRKVNATRVDIYPLNDYKVRSNRIERETFLKAKAYFEGKVNNA